MSRAAWKGPFLTNFLLKRKIKQNSKIWFRGSVIPYSLIGQNVLVHNGKMFKKLFISREKVGYKFGEFCYTRTFNINKKFRKKNKQLKNKK